MTDLTTLQHELLACLHEGDDLNELKMVATVKVPLETRLAIYQNAYALRLVEALASNYPVLATILGEDEFNQLALDYIANNPSTFKSIRWFGHELSEFIINNLDHQYNEAFVELAHFEWLQTCVFDAADDDIVTIEEMSRLPPEEWVDLTFTVHSSVHLIQLNWNVVAVYQAINANQSAPLLTKSNDTVQWILWRQDKDNRFCSLPNDEAFYLDALIAGHTFAELVTFASERMEMESAAMHVVSLLKGWLDVGLIATISKTKEIHNEA